MSISRLALVASIAVVTLAVLIGLYLSGSPAQQRLDRIDERRVQDLSRISHEIGSYYERTRRLPAELTQLVDGQRMRTLPVDPETGEPYGYEITDADVYRLCATFSTSSRAELTADFWWHEAGQWCYRFEPAL